MQFAKYAVVALVAQTGMAAAGNPMPAPLDSSPVPAYVEIYEGDPGWTGAYGGFQLSKEDGKFQLPKGAKSDVSATGIGAHAGYLHDIGSAVLGAEVSYDKLRDLKLGSTKTDGSALRGKFLAGYNAGNFLPYATVGVERISFDKAGTSGKDLSETGMVYGLGMKYRLSDSVLLGAEVLRHNFKDVGDVKGQRLDTTTVGASVSFKF